MDVNDWHSRVEKDEDLHLKNKDTCAKSHTKPDILSDKGNFWSQNYLLTCEKKGAFLHTG